MHNYLKNLDVWSHLKGVLHIQDKEQHQYKDIHERDIVWCSVGLNIGYEIYGKGELFNRPVLVYKKISSELFIGLPFTKKIKKRTGWYFYSDKEGCIVFEQIRTFSVKRAQSRHKKISKRDFNAITQALLSYMSPQ